MVKKVENVVWKRKATSENGKNENMSSEINLVNFAAVVGFTCAYIKRNFNV